MKKNKVIIFLVFICILQLAIPFSIMGLREFASENGLQGKIKVTGVFYSAIKETLDFDVAQAIYSKDGTGYYIPVHLDKNGYIVAEDRISVKPSGSYIDWKIFRDKKDKYNNHELEFFISENELNRLTITRMGNLSFDDFYVTVSIHNGEVIFKELWEKDTLLVKFR